MEKVIKLKKTFEDNGGNGVSNFSIYRPASRSIMGSDKNRGQDSEIDLWRGKESHEMKLNLTTIPSVEKRALCTKESVG